jgi:hypothetical protein
LAPHSEAAFDSNKPPVVVAFPGVAEMVAVVAEAEGRGDAEAQVAVGVAPDEESVLALAEAGIGVLVYTGVVGEAPGF